MNSWGNGLMEERYDYKGKMGRDLGALELLEWVGKLGSILG